MENILLHPFPKYIQINSITYAINSDFRIGIQFEKLLKNNELDDVNKIQQILELYYPIIPLDKKDALTKILWFYSCGVDNHDQKNTTSHIPLYSFEDDQFMVYTDFIKNYQIDLAEIEYMHWWKFKQLFLNLSDDSEMKKVMGYRSIKLNSKMSKEQKQFYLRMKRIYRLSSNNIQPIDKAKEYGAVLSKALHLNKT